MDAVVLCDAQVVANRVEKLLPTCWATLHIMRRVSELSMRRALHSNRPNVLGNSTLLLQFEILEKRTYVGRNLAHRAVLISWRAAHPTISSCGESCHGRS